MQTPNRRHVRNYFPEPAFQKRFLLFLIGGSFLPITASLAVLYYFLRENYLLLIKYAALEKQVAELLMRELNILIAVIGFLFLGYLVAITLFGIAFSHRIAGVIFAVKNACRLIAEGTETTLRLRRKDEFRDLANEFNNMVAALKLRQKSAA